VINHQQSVVVQKEKSRTRLVSRTAHKTNLHGQNITKVVTDNKIFVSGLSRHVTPRATNDAPILQFSEVNPFQPKGCFSVATGWYSGVTPQFVQGSSRRTCDVRQRPGRSGQSACLHNEKMGSSLFGPEVDTEGSRELACSDGDTARLHWESCCMLREAAFF
jgi:hypothetical protein